MNSPWSIIAAEFAERADGPLALRLLLQPLIASILAVRSGLRDAAAGKHPYGWRLLVADGASRIQLIRDGWHSVGMVLLLTTGLDVVYQLIVHGDVLPRQAIILAVLIALIPYLILRGLTTWIVREIGKART